MKFRKIYFLASAFAALAFSSCSNNDEPVEPTIDDNRQLVDFNNSALTYSTTTGAWIGCYDPAQENALVFYNMKFSHDVGSYMAGESEVFYWRGFCPSVSSDKRDWEDDWTEHQWSIMPGGGYNPATGGIITGSAFPFMIANWDVAESTETIPDSPSLLVKPAINVTFQPLTVAVTNTTWGYYGMVNGTAYSAQFGKNDWCKIIAVGVKNGRITDTAEFYLYENGQGVTTWRLFDVSALGQVDYMYFQMASSDSGIYGMNNPAFFALGIMSLIPGDESNSGDQLTPTPAT